MAFRRDKTTLKDLPVVSPLLATHLLRSAAIAYCTARHEHPGQSAAVLQAEKELHWFADLLYQSYGNYQVLDEEGSPIPVDLETLTLGNHKRDEIRAFLMKHEITVI